MFCDLCINSNGKSGQEITRSCLRTAAELGYQAVAVNQKESVKILNEGTKKEKRIYAAPVPETCKLSDDDIRSVKALGKNFTQYSRISVTVVGNEDIIRLRQSNIQQYDIVAASIKDVRLARIISEQNLADILIVDLAEEKPFRPDRTALKLAAKAGIHFEIQYSSAILDVRCRRRILGRMRDLEDLQNMTVKNVIFSSGANRRVFLRDPANVINMVKFFMGINDVRRARDSITESALKVIEHGRQRRTGGIVTIQYKRQDITSQPSSSSDHTADDESEIIDSKTVCQKEEIGSHGTEITDNKSKEVVVEHENEKRGKKRKKKNQGDKKRKKKGRHVHLDMLH